MYGWYWRAVMPGTWETAETHGWLAWLFSSDWPGYDDPLIGMIDDRLGVVGLGAGDTLEVEGVDLRVVVQVRDVDAVVLDGCRRSRSDPP